MDFLKQPDSSDSVPSSTETGGTHFLAPGGLSDSQVLQEPGDRSHWCVVAYWEEKTRVGRLYSVQEPSLDIFYDLPQGNGFCLGQLNSDNKSQLVQKVRGKIGYGIQLTKEGDGVWVYNRSCYPIFIKSATLDNPDSRTLLVHKVFPGFSIKAFEYEKAYSLQRPNDHEFTQQPWTGFTVQISFVKGWGQCYTRQFISSCPCWLEECQEFSRHVFQNSTDSQVLQEPGDRSHWCVVAYWEEKTRVGRLYSVQEPSLDIFYDLPQGNGFCLGQLNSDNKSQLVQKVRGKIGYGIQLTKEGDGVWVYNRSCYPIFIKSATLDNPDSRTLLVHKVFPGFSIKAFEYEKAYSLQRPNDHEFTQQPWTGFTVQISFVKGWGQCYTRQFISSCPCWLEVIFNNR
ncbi:UNVERIFIED_CONTAM: hypothetical protein FKN15_022689 [Acipenser sinensis]